MIGLSALRLVTAFLAFAFVSLIAPKNCSAHGGVSMENDMCKLRAGPYVLHFTGYQPYSAPELEFCEDIPDTGYTLIVLDYLDTALRDMPVEARIIRDTGDESSLAQVTVYHKPAALYPTGSFVIEHTFPEPGRFIGVVTVGDQVSRFPFAVGTRGWQTLVLYTMFAVVAVGVGGLLYLYSSRKG